jgi:insulysin
MRKMIQPSYNNILSFYRFSQFFISPFFTEDASAREVCAVNSEFEKNLPCDDWRLHQLEQSISKPGHPCIKFGTGNKKTLDEDPKAKGVNVRNQLLNFHSTWYSSNIMSLAILGKGLSSNLVFKVEIII